MGWLKRKVEKWEADGLLDCQHPQRRDDVWLIAGVPYAVRVCTECGHSITVGLAKG